MAKAWRLIFVPDLVQNFFGKESCVDFRLHRPDSNVFHKGQIIEGHFHEGFMLLLEVLEDTTVCTLDKIPAQVRNVWGSPARPKTSIAQTIARMQELYPTVHITTETVFSVNRLRLPRVNGRATAGFLPDDLNAQLASQPDRN